MTDIIIYGRGKTGQSLRNMLREMGEESIFYDDITGFDDGGSFSKNSLVLLSPGVKPDSDGIIAARKAGSKLMSELEYCFPLCKGKCISVTGTNGKTTTCEMIYHILSQNNLSCSLLGNGGVPLSSRVLQVESDELVVLESSSFQLLNATSFAPYISVFTNLACDHLNYHGSYDSYVLAKINNFIHQRTGYAIFNADDSNVVELSKSCTCRKLYYSLKSSKANCYYDGNEIILHINDEVTKCHSTITATFARHNLSNALAAVIVAYITGIKIEAALQSLLSYKLLPHRMDTVATVDGVTFVDDSKATNVHATLSALKNYKENLALILGGSDKGEQFDDIFKCLSSNVVAVTASGETAGKIAECGEKYGVQVVVFDDIEQATEYCYKTVVKHGGGVVLMSNACASFDRFDGYEERGEYFCRVVKGLSGDKKTN